MLYTASRVQCGLVWVVAWIIVHACSPLVPDTPVRISAATPRPSTANHSRLLIAIALLAALLLRLAGVGRVPWLDEALTLRWIHAANVHDWLAAVHSDAVPPAYPVLLTAWASISDSVTWLRLFSVVCGLGTVALGMRWAAACSRRAVLPAALLLSSSPFLLRYAVELRAYALVGLATAWVGLASWQLASSREVRARHTASLLLALLLACLTHFTAVLLVPAAIVLMLTAASDRPLARVPWLGVGGVCAVWAIVVVASNAQGVVGGVWWMPPLTSRLAWLTFGEVLGAAGPGIGMPALVQATWLVLLLALGAVFVMAEPARAWTAPLGAAVAYWACLACVSLVWQPVWWPRTMLPGLVLLLVSLATASNALRTTALRRSATAVVLALSLFGAARWVGGEARRAIEPWQQVVDALPPPAARAPVFVLADYSVAPLVERRLGGREGPVALRLDGRGNRERMTAAMAAGQGSPLTLVVRVDLTVMASPDALTSVLTQVAEVRGAWPMRVLLVMSPDVSLVPHLRETRATVEARAARLFGAPVERREEPALTSLTFAPGR